MIDNSTFAIKNEWQIRQRNEILKPLFYDRYFPGKYRFLNSANPTQRDYDTIVERESNIKVEEKIVRWPSKDGVALDKPYDAFALETMSCTIPGYESRGWMHTSTANKLIYCFSIPESEVGLDCYVMDMQALKAWFWRIGEDNWAFTRTKEYNRTECRVVPIRDVIAGGIKMKRYMIGPGWPDSHFCEVCCAEAGYGHDYFPRQGKLGVWFCSDHNPKEPALPSQPVAPVQPSAAQDARWRRRAASFAGASLADVQAELRRTEGEEGLPLWYRAGLWRSLDRLVAAAASPVESKPPLALFNPQHEQWACECLRYDKDGIALTAEDEAWVSANGGVAWQSLAGSHRGG